MHMGIGRSMLKFRLHEMAQEGYVLAPGHFKYDLLQWFANLGYIYAFEPEERRVRFKPAVLLASTYLNTMCMHICVKRWCRLEQFLKQLPQWAPSLSSVDVPP